MPVSVLPTGTFNDSVTLGITLFRETPQFHLTTFSNSSQLRLSISKALTVDGTFPFWAI